jgi:hypothetical protein
MMGGLEQALQAVGLLPADTVLPTDGIEGGHNLLPRIIAAWAARPSASSSDQRNGREECLARLTEFEGQGAALTWGLPGPVGDRAARWLGPRLAWWPHGIPTARWIGVASSRLGRELDHRKAWFTVLRAVCQKIDPQADLLLAAGHTSTERFVERCGELFGLRVLRLDIDSGSDLSPKTWGARLLTAKAPGGPERLAVSFSPRLSWESSEEREVAGDESTPADRAQASGGASARRWCSVADASAPADRAVAALSERLFVLHARRHGNWDQLLRRRLDDPAFPPASVCLALGPDLVPKDLGGELLDRGAVGWVVLNALGQTDDSAEPPGWPAKSPGREPAPIMAWPRSEAGDYLMHCTRRRRGPWPGEAEADFLDELILDRAGADHSAWAALWRIVQTRRLAASGALIRGGTPVVCFSAAPLDELSRRHVFRSHLGRWDFEPYGICIRRSWLESCGTRPVVYGDETSWASLSPDERPWFQRAESRTPRGTVWDWTAEQEWRHLGDLPLAELPGHLACVFVPSEREAELLARVSPWPVAVLPEP